jgi:membrane associated rhomboid family serine protease
VTNLQPAPARPSYLSIAPATTLTIALNVGVYLWMGLHGVSWTRPSTVDLFAWGADLPLFTLTGDGWRLFTCMFLHAGPVHLGLNMYALFFTGARVEMEFGSPRMLAIYLAGGLLSSCASVYWGALHLLDTDHFGHAVPHLVVSVGASGAIMALFGSLLALVLVPDPRLAAGGPRAPIDTSLIQVVAINLGLGFLIQGVDQAAHVGGLVGGVAIGLIMAAAPSLRGPGGALARFGAAALLTVACVATLLHSGDRQQLEALRAQMNGADQTDH